MSLFANVGIAEFYLNEIGIEILVANELLDKRANLYKYFHPNSNIIC
ncbi:MAG: DNA cytosine methyltransferase [bacterium]|nr:DNA cytosine methyltransferase [bacterium]MDP3381399.1 DNA cytosine methyltransferase [bacterium]